MAVPPEAELLVWLIESHDDCTRSLDRLKRHFALMASADTELLLKAAERTAHKARYNVEHNVRTAQPVRKIFAEYVEQLQKDS